MTKPPFIKLNIKHIFLFVLLFVILYIEQISIGGLKISHIWKISAIYALVLSLFILLSKQSKNLNRPLSITWGYLFALWPLVVSGTFEDPYPSIFLAGTRLFPILTIHFLYEYRIKANTIIKLLNTLVIFVIISAIPFVLGILKPLGKTYDLTDFSNIQGNSFVGIFQKPHPASLTLALCIIIVLNNLYNPNNNRRIQTLWICCISVLINLLILTYVRAGIAVALAGVILYFILENKFKKLFKIILIGIPIILIGYSVIPDTAGFKNRMLGRNIYTKTQDTSANQFTSGRFEIWESSLSIYQEQDRLTQLTGLGQSKFFTEMIAKMGTKYVAHNGFLDELVLHGFIGAFIMVGFVFTICRDILQISSRKERIKALTCFVGFTCYILVQTLDVPLQLLALLLFTLLPRRNLKIKELTTIHNEQHTSPLYKGRRVQPMTTNQTSSSANEIRPCK